MRQYSMNFPGHNYLGPGNPIDNGEPVDADDRIARQHNLDYESATTAEDIRAADMRAISAFGRDLIGTGNWHSLVGVAGLFAKYSVESATGVLYPNMSGSRTSDAEPSGPDHSSVVKRMAGAKRQKVDSNADAAEEENATVGTSGGGGSGTTMHLHTPLNQFKTGKLIFTHHRLMRSCGNQFVHLDTNLKPDSNIKLDVVTTPLAYVPVDIIPWYLSPEEFRNLPISSEVTRLTTVCSPLGFRLPFTANSASFQYTNNEQFMMTAHAFGLNNKYQGVNVKNGFSADNPMLPTALELKNSNYEYEWYGDVATGFAIDFAKIPCAFGNQLPLHEYYVQNYDNVTGNDTLPEVMKDLHLCSILNGIPHPPITYEYRPQVCVLKPMKTDPPFRKNNTYINLGIKNNYISFYIE